MENIRQTKQELLNELYRPYRDHRDCPFATPDRKNVVFGVGNPNAQIMFVGEAPGRDEDAQGEPFVGRSGKLLTSILEQFGLSRGDVFITNVVKCRPPNNRRPLQHEIAACTGHLLEQEVAIIDPRVICTLGSCATESILQHPVKITQLRGQKLDWKGKILIPTYHPAYILRNGTQLPFLAHDIQTAIELAQI